MTAIVPGAQFGWLEVLSSDKLGRHIACRCACSRVITLSATALLDGRDSCGCRPPSAAVRAALQSEQQDQARRRDFAWRRPEKRR